MWKKKITTTTVYRSNYERRGVILALGSKWRPRFLSTSAFYKIDNFCFGHFTWNWSQKKQADIRFGGTSIFMSEIILTPKLCTCVFFCFLHIFRVYLGICVRFGRIVGDKMKNNGPLFLFFFFGVKKTVLWYFCLGGNPAITVSFAWQQSTLAWRFA